MEVTGEFDYIVVGGGSAGCVIAARLSESGTHQVALLEAGGEDNSFWIHAPLGYGKLYDNPKYNWLYESEPEVEFNNHKSFQSRGKVLGGTGSINGMIYMRGHREDFDGWRQLGNVGWSYEDVLPYFKVGEDNEMGADAFHGVGGPLHVSNPPKSAITEAFITAGEQAGFKRNTDFNGAEQDGFGYNQLTIRNGRRCSTAVAYLGPARSRPNLTVVTNAQAQRILFHDKEAYGVEFRRGGKTEIVTARREIVVSGGSFNSPQLLQLSGIGPADLLRQYGIPVVADSKGVGENLQDHVNVSMAYGCTQPITINDMLYSPLRRTLAGIRYLLFRTGPMAANGSLCGCCIRTDPALSSPDVKVNLQLWVRGYGGAKNKMGLTCSSSFSVTMSLLRPDNRGTVHIKSADPTIAPEIRFNFFASEADHRASVEAVKIMRRVMAMPAILPYVSEELSPGKNCTSDNDILAFCREMGRTTHHASGTCKMGVDERAVVDPRLRVHGIGRLRVADASIMPRIVSGNTNAGTIMIGEKCSAMILEDARNR